MSNRKTELKFFDVMDYEKEAEYLSAMHRKGWKFVHVSFPGLYHFVKCEPENVSYQLDYNQEGIANREEYCRMFEDLGWEYMFDFVGYSYFRKPVAEGEQQADIFCDDDSRWEMMKRIFRGRLTPMIVLFFLTIVPTLLVALTDLGVYRFIAVYMGALLLLYVTIFARFAVKYYRFKQKLGR